MIGNFHTNTGQNKIPNPNYDGNNFLSYTVSNYLIDDVSVSESCAVCGNGVVEQNEACDDGNADEFDGCTSQCTVNQCQTTLLNKIDPSIIYRRGYLERTAQSTTNIVMDLYTPTVSANYQYQWTLSGINTTGLNTFGFSGSTTTT